MSELQANFKAQSYNVVGRALAPMDKEHVGSHPKMLLFALDELSYVYQYIDNIDMQHVVAYEMLSFTSHRCTEWHNGMPKPECDMHRPAMPHINLGDLGSLKRLAWAVYDGIYVPGNQPTLSDPRDWVCILIKTMTHIFHGRTLQEHCPQAPLEAPMWLPLSTCKGPSNKAIWERELAEETPSTAGTSISCLQDTNTLVSHECAIMGHHGLC